MEFLWHMIELAPLGFIAGWAWVRWGKKPLSAVVAPPTVDKPTVYDPNPFMIWTEGPKGRGDPPARAMKAVRHPMQKYPVWDLDERGWPLQYTLVPNGYVMNDAGEIVPHADPAYNGTSRETA